MGIRYLSGLLLLIVALTLTVPSVGSAQLSGTTQANSLTDAEKADGWRLLFDGRSLLGWVPRGGDALWSVDDGSITAVSTGLSSQIGSAEEYTNFRLLIDYWTDEGHNSGIYFRGPRAPLALVHQFSFYEVNISDDHKTFPTGSLVDILRYDPTPKSAGQWNTYDIMAEGNHIVVKLNGTTTIDITNGLHYSGVIALQAWGKGRVKFRTIKIKPLP